MSSIEVLRRGLLDTIQDQGRLGYQQFGIPCSGAMDNYSLLLGNSIVGNSPDEAGIEITMTGPRLRFRGDTVFSVTGGTFSPTLNEIQIPMYRAILAKKDDILELGTALQGMRGYIAFGGGVQSPKQMGSRSTYMLGRIGGLGGNPLQIGDIVPLGSLPYKHLVCLTKRNAIANDFIPVIEDEVILRVILGPELERFTEQAVSNFLRYEYCLTSQSNRMGLRLAGEPLSHSRSADILSAGLSLGAVQVPGHGQPIIMMVDRQTTGGYPRIANVISVDIPKLAQLRPGGRMRFQAVDVRVAHSLIAQEDQKIDSLRRAWGSTAYQVTMDGQRFSVVVEEI